MKKTVLLILLSVLALTFPKPARAVTVTLTATADTSIISAHPQDNLNVPPNASAYDDRGRTLFVYNETEGRQEPLVYYSLMKFDLSPIPQNARVNVAKLNLFRQNITGSNRNGTMLLTPAAEPWDEGTVNWWGKPPAVTSRVLSFPITRVDQRDRSYFSYQEYEIKDMVQDWVNGAYANNGFYLKMAPADNLAQEFRSRETTQEVNRTRTIPKLIVDYTVMPAPTPTPAPATPAPPAAVTSTPAATSAGGFDLEGELSQVLTAKNLKIAAIAFFALLAIKIVLFH